MQINKEEIDYIKKEYRFSNKALKIVKKSLAKEKPKNENAKQFFEMAEAYLNDALYFLKNKDYLRAIAAIYYGHAWLDAGARLGFWKIKGKNKRYFSMD